MPSLHKFLEHKLHRSKWPQVIVYMNGLPKNATGKILRIKFAERCQLLQHIDEEQSPMLRLYEGICPPPGASLRDPISISPVIINEEETRLFCLENSNDYLDDCKVIKMDLSTRLDSLICFVKLNDTVTNNQSKSLNIVTYLQDLFSKYLHCYLIPMMIIVLPSIPNDLSYLQREATSQFQLRNVIAPRNHIEIQIESIWREQLQLSSMISIKDSFFDIGGDSLRAGQVINIMRKKMKIHLSVADIFEAPTIESMSFKVSIMKTLGSPAISSSPSIIQSSSSNANTTSSSPSTYPESMEDTLVTWYSISPLSNTSWNCLFTQSLPFIIIYPIRRILNWFLIAIPWVYYYKLGYDRFQALLIAMFLSRCITGMIFPLIAILCKWIIIGKYRIGRYPLWGSMYLQWWIVEQIINIMGKGFYRDDIPIVGAYLTRIYYRLMGASIGRNVRIHHNAKLGQYDLLSIGDDATIDNAYIRPFALEEGHFSLLPISIGAGSCVGVKSVIASGTSLPSKTCIGPLSSSHELKDANVKNRKYCRQAFSSPPLYLILLLGIPILILVFAISLLPWVGILHLMIQDAKTHGWYQSDLNTVFDAFMWWSHPRRLVYYFILRIIRRCIIPFIRLFLAILIKWTLIGKFMSLNELERKDPWNLFKYWLMSRLLSSNSLNGVAKLVGTHYEVISIIYRLLGSKIGKRVYWPGSGLDIVEYDLLEVGDDVVFGSRSVIMTSSTSSSKRIVIESGAMVADRCVLLPGSILRRGSVLGSGSLACEDMEVAMGSVWVGSKEGKAVNVAPKDTTFATKETISPFGRAFYLREASYQVFSLGFVFFYNITWQAICTW